MADQHLSNRLEAGFEELVGDESGVAHEGAHSSASTYELALLGDKEEISGPVGEEDKAGEAKRRLPLELERQVAVRPKRLQRVYEALRTDYSIEQRFRACFSLVGKRVRNAALYKLINRALRLGGDYNCFLLKPLKNGTVGIPHSTAIYRYKVVDIHENMANEEIVYVFHAFDEREDFGDSSRRSLSESEFGEQCPLAALFLDPADWKLSGSTLSSFERRRKGGIKNTRGLTAVALAQWEELFHVYNRVLVEQGGSAEKVVESLGKAVFSKLRKRSSDLRERERRLANMELTIREEEARVTREAKLKAREDRKNKKRERWTCKVSGCTKWAIRQGLCIAHGAQVPRCNVDGCTSAVKNSGVCIAHGAKIRTCEMQGCNLRAKRTGFCEKHGSQKAGQDIIQSNEKPENGESESPSFL